MPNQYNNNILKVRKTLHAIGNTLGNTVILQCTANMKKNESV